LNDKEQKVQTTDNKQIILDLLIFLSLLFIPAGLKVEIRNALFSSAVDESYFNLPPEYLSEKNNNFIWYDPAVRDSFKLKIKQKKEIDSLESLQLSDRELIKKLALIFSKNGNDEPGDCGRYSDELVKNMEWLNTENGKGCCSDHAQVLIAYSLLANISCREVHNIPHTFNEYFDRQENKWIWIDPQFCLMAKDSADNFLSLLEIQNYYKADHQPLWQFFGTKEHVASRIEPSLINGYFIKESFDAIRMTLGNNVFSVDKVNHELKYLPRNIRQLYLLSIKKQPGWVYHSNEKKMETYYHIIKYGFYSFISLLLLFNLIFIYKNSRFLKGLSSNKLQ